MKWGEKTHLLLFVWWMNIKEIKARIWNKHILLWWYRLWVRKNEFHRSLELDYEAMLAMDEAERHDYLHDLLRRQKIAHIKDLRRCRVRRYRERKGRK